MKRRASMVLCWIAAALLAGSGCGRREPQPAADTDQRDRELRKFQAGVRTVQERYVDADRVQFDILMSNSIKGMVAEIDPHATLLFSGGPASEGPVIPDDVPLVELVDLEGQRITVLKVYGFQPQMRKQLRALEAEARNRSLAAILIDARGASGTDYQAAADLAAWLLPRNAAVGALVDKQGEPARAVTTRRAPVWPSNPVLMLVDRDTAGPAEWLASALQFHHRVRLFGEPTRGLTVQQTPVPVTDQWTVLLTTGRALNPDGRDITGSPLVPDLPATPDPDNRENVDWLYLHALESLKAELDGE
jgi:C-terminal processing protease CtpA/Prc